MLVRFSVRAWRTTSGLSLWLLAAGCSLVVGELQEPLPEGGGPVAGAGSSAGGGGTVAGSSSAGGTRSLGQGGEASAQAGDGPAPGAGTSGSGAMCDADRDEHLAEGKCGGDDCDDSDDRVSPDQTEYFGERQKNVDFDYDCSGAPEQEEVMAVVCPGVVGPCPTETGFLKSLPACGETGSYGTCVKQAPLDTCVEKVLDAEHRMRCH
jgi:hypothetical protein